MSLATDPQFGQRLRELRAAAGLSQSQLAELIGVSRQFIYLLESGDKDPSWSTVRKIARALGVSLAAFDAESGQPEPPATEPAVEDPAKPPARKRKKK